MIGLQFVEEVQGHFIRTLLPRRFSGPISSSVYRQAHALHIQKHGATPHEVRAPLFMEVNHNRWTAVCPECSSGVTTGRLWKESRCFGCGAIFVDTQWPVDMPAIEAILLKRPPNARHWKPGETIGSLVVDNVLHGKFTDLRRGLPPDVQKALSGTPLLLGE